MAEIIEKSRGAVVKNDLPEETDKPVTKVKCLCVYGTCRQGESTCDKCYDGYEGVLCDIRSRSYNRTGRKETIEDQEEIEETVFRKGKKAARIDDTNTEPERKTPKYTEIKKEQPSAIEADGPVALK